MFGKIGLPELVLILVIALIIFGPRKLPDIGRSIGRGIREFRQATTEISKTVSLDDEEDEKTGVSVKKEEDKEKEESNQDDKTGITGSEDTQAEQESEKEEIQEAKEDEKEEQETINSASAEDIKKH